MNIEDQYDPDYFYLKDSASIEKTVKYLYSKGQDEKARTVLDLMRMSENWYGRLQEANKLIDNLMPPKAKND